MRFNNLFALVIFGLIMAYLLAASALGWENKTVDLATGSFLTLLTLVVQYFFRKRSGEADPPGNGG
jgi:hypothetical protein